MEYNVMGSPAQLAAMLKALPSLKVTERYAASDWSVLLPDDPSYVDRLTEWCEDNGLECNLA